MNQKNRSKRIGVIQFDHPNASHQRETDRLRLTIWIWWLSGRQRWRDARSVCVCVCVAFVIAEMWTEGHDLLQKHWFRLMVVAWMSGDVRWCSGPVMLSERGEYQIRIRCRCRCQTVFVFLQWPLGGAALHHSLHWRWGRRVTCYTDTTRRSANQIPNRESVYQ